jgi:hypothetical protein
MEMTMRKNILTVFAVSLIATLAVQAAAASERHRVRTKASVEASERFRNSKAYFAPADYPVPGYSVPWYSSNVYDGASGSGMAGH